MSRILGAVRLLLLSLFIAGPAHAQIDPAFIDTATGRVDTLLADNDIPGAVVLVDDGQQRIVIARGLANRETGLAMSPDQLLRVASVGKLYTAAVIHRLVLDGRLGLDDRLADLVDAGWIEDIANADRATVRQLLNHTSGIPDYYDDTWFAEVDTVHLNTPERTLAHIRGVAAEFEPGTDHAYSNTNYQYLALIAQAVTGQSMAGLCQAYLFEPLGLTDTGYDIQFDPRDVIHGYGSERDPEADTYALQENNGPDGGIFATAGDLADFLNAVYGENGRLHDIGVSMLSDLYDRGEGHYRALGPSYTEHPLGFSAITHGGSIAGYGTIVIRAISHDVTVIVHVNRDRPDLAGALARDLLFDVLGATPASAE